MDRRTLKKGTTSSGRRQRLLGSWPFVVCAAVLLWAYRDHRYHTPRRHTPTLALPQRLKSACAFLHLVTSPDVWLTRQFSLVSPMRIVVIPCVPLGHGHISEDE